MKTKLTERNADTLSAPKTGGRKSGGVNSYYRDIEVTGFALRVGAGGARFWIIEYTLGKRQRTYVIGKRELYTVAAARTKAKELLGGVAQGIDPAESRREAVAAQTGREGAPTFRELYDKWLAEVGIHKKSASHDRSSRKKFANFENKRAREITSGQIEAVLAGLRDTPIAANRALALIKTVCRWGERKHHLEYDPAKGIERPHKENQREWYLSRTELDELYYALDAHEDKVGANAIKLLVWTGARLREVLHAKWHQFDFERGRFSKGETKSGSKVTIPLDAPALDLLREMKRTATSEWVFPSRTKPTVPRWDVDNVWHPVRKALAAVRAELGDMHIHDLRHVYATALLVSGASEASIAPLLGHKSTAMTKRYAHTSPDYLAAERAKLTRALAPPAPKRIAPPTSKRGRKVVAR